MIKHVKPTALRRIDRSTLVKVCDENGKPDPSLENTVLHQLLHPKEIPQIDLDGHTITIMESPKIWVRPVYDEQGACLGHFANLPGSLHVIDTTISLYLRGRPVPVNFYKDIVATSFQKVLEDKVVHHAVSPGLMRFCLGDDGQLSTDEVGISLYDARKLVLEIFKDANSPVSKAMEARILTGSVKGARSPQYQQVLASLSIAALENKSATTKDVPPQVAIQLDGMQVFALRYPNASPTSAKLKTLRIYGMTPENAMFFPVKDLVEHHQGDCDGDRGFIVVTGVEVKPPKPLKWRLRPIFTNSYLSTEFLENLTEETEPLQAIIDASQRGQWIGLLTYNCIWLLGYAAANHYTELGFKTPQDAWPAVLGCATPLIEGVMDARKGKGAGYLNNNQSMAALVCAIFGGMEDISLTSELPKCEPGEVDDKKFTPEKLEFLNKLLSIIAGLKNTAQLRNPLSGASMDEVIFHLIVSRGKRPNIHRLLQVLGKYPFEKIWNSLMCKQLYPITQGTMDMFFHRRISSREDFEEEEAY